MEILSIIDYEPYYPKYKPEFLEYVKKAANSVKEYERRIHLTDWK
jgi:hypothetical protein